MDFIEHGSRDPFLYVNYSNSFYSFITKVEKDHGFKLTKKQEKLLELFSKEVNNAKRIEESYILKQVLINGKLSIKEFKNSIF